MQIKMWTRDEIQKVIDNMGTKASSDGSFMTKCLTDLHGAIQEVAEGEIPAGTIVSFKGDSILVKKSNEPEMVFDMPALVSASGELSDSHLEAVAGGKKSHTASVSWNETSGWGGSVGITF